MQAIKAELNKHHENGQWLLSGSTSSGPCHAGTQALTDRLQFVEVMPFSQGELDGVHENFLDVAFTEPAALATPRRALTERTEYEYRTCRGGMPLAVHVDARRRANLYRGYLGAALGDQFSAGFFLNTGTEAYEIEDRIYVCPIDRIWSEN